MTYINDTDRPVVVEFITDPDHYRDGHQCDGQCRTASHRVEPGGRLVFSTEEDNGHDIIEQCARAGMESLA